MPYVVLVKKGTAPNRNCTFNRVGIFGTVLKKIMKVEAQRIPPTKKPINEYSIQNLLINLEENKTKKMPTSVVIILM